MNTRSQQQFYIGNGLEAQKRQFIESRLKENFPRKLNSVYAGSLLLAGVLGIILEFVIITNATPETTVYGGGIWGGIAGIVCSAVAVSLNSNRTYGAHRSNVITQSLGVSALFVGYTGLNISIISDHANCIYSCDIYGAIGANITLLIVGIIVFIFMCVYMLKINHSITGRYYYNSNGLFGPNTTVVVIAPQPNRVGQPPNRYSHPTSQPPPNRYGQPPNRYGQPSQPVVINPYAKPPQNQYAQNAQSQQQPQIINPSVLNDNQSNMAAIDVELPSYESINPHQSAKM